MKMKSPGILVLAAVLCLLICLRPSEAVVVHTFEETSGETGAAGGEEIVFKTYYEMSDHTWEADGRTYRERLVATGRLHNAERDTTYTILSNIGDISFAQAWKASGLSSNLYDYLAIEDAVLVAVKQH